MTSSSMSSAELLFQSLHKFKNYISQSELPPDSQDTDEAFESICKEVRLHFRDTITEHLQNNGHIYLNLSDAESILELIEVVVSEYNQVFTSSFTSKNEQNTDPFQATEVEELSTPRSKKPKLDLKRDESLATLKYFFFCCYNIVSEPLLAEILYPKCVKICEKCLGSLANRDETLLAEVVEEILRFCQEVSSAFPLFNTWNGIRNSLDYEIEFKSFDCSDEFVGCKVNVQFQICLDNFLKFSFQILTLVWRSNVELLPSRIEKLLDLFRNCLFNSNDETKEVIIENLVQFVENFKQIKLISQNKLLPFISDIAQFGIFLAQSNYPPVRNLMKCLVSLASKFFESNSLPSETKQFDELAISIVQKALGQSEEFSVIFNRIGDMLNELLTIVYFQKFDSEIDNFTYGTEALKAELQLKIQIKRIEFHNVVTSVAKFEQKSDSKIAQSLFESSKSQFIAIVYTFLKFKHENSSNSTVISMKEILEDTLMQIDLKFNSTSSNDSDCVSLLRTVRTILHTIAFLGLKSSTYLEVLSAELLFDCASVVKKLVFKSNLTIQELTCGLEVLQRFLLLTFSLKLEENLLLDVAWISSLAFPWFDLKLDWKELEVFKKQKKHISVYTRAKELVSSTDIENCQKLIDLSGAITSLMFQHFGTKTAEHFVSACLLVNLKNLFQISSSKNVLMSSIPPIIWVLMKSEAKIAERILITQFLNLETSSSALNHLKQLVYALTYYNLTAKNSEETYFLDIDPFLIQLRIFIKPAINFNLDIKSCDDTIWQSFILPLLNKLKRSENCSNDDMLSFLLEVIPISPNFEDLLPYFLSDLFRSKTANDSALKALNLMIQYECNQIQHSEKFWGDLIKFFQESTPENAENVCDFHISKAKLYGSILERVDQKSERVEIQNFVSFGFKNLIGYLFSNNEEIRNISCESLKISCSNPENFSLSDAFTQFKEIVCDTWSAIVGLKFEAFCKKSSVNNNSPGSDIPNIENLHLEFVEQLVFLCQAFTIEPSPTIVRDISPLILSSLFLLNGKLAQIYCKEIGSQLMKENVDDFISGFLVQIVASLLSRGVDEPKSYFDSNFPKVCENWNGFLLSKIVPISFSLASFVHDFEERVLNFGLPYLAEIDYNFQDSFKKRSIKEDNFEISKLYLSFRLLAVMTNFKSVLLSGSAGKAAKVRRLKSTVKIIEVVSQDTVSLNDKKLLDVLRLIPKLKLDNFQKVLIEAYEKFIAKLYQPNLQSLAPQIAYDVKSIQSLASLELINKLKLSFQDDLTSFYFLPYRQDNTQNERFLKNVSKIDEVVAHLETVVKGLKEETVETKYFVLQNFLTVLQMNPEVGQFFVDVETLHEGRELVEFIRILILQFNVDDLEVQLLVSQILGFIGAIDASKVVDLRFLASKTGFKTECSTETLDFKFRLLTILAHSLSSSCNSEPRMVDCCAYSIQELLKVFECNPNLSSYTGQKLWSKFDQETQAFLSPYLRSKYSYNCRSLLTSSEAVRFYMDENVTSYKQWICKLVKYLASFVSDPKSFAIFTACDAVFNYNVDVAVFLLPVIVIQLIYENNDTCKSLVIQEFLKVMRDCCSSKCRPFAKVCCQTVFLTLETISNYEASLRSEKLWENAKRVDSSNEKSTVLVKCDMMKEFLSHIMSNTISKAAFACKAYARALFYTEDHLSKLDDPDSELSLMQKCFLELNEPDGVKGVNAIRKRKLNSIEKILNYKSQNRMNEALVCCSTAISQNPASVALIKEYLGCFLAIGQADSAKYHAWGYLSENDSSRSSIEPICMEACWQLSDWSKLTQLLANHNQALTDESRNVCKNDFQVDFSSCILSLSAKNWSKLDSSLKDARKTQINSVTAATMDFSNAYLRAYESVAKLQMISSVEIVSQLLKNQSTDNLDSIQILKTCDHLESRLNILQPSFSILEPERQLYRCLLNIIKVSIEKTEQNADKLLQILDARSRSSWLETSKAARAIGYFDTALKGLENSLSEYGSNVENILEHSLLLKSKGNHYEGLMMLQKFLDNQNLKVTSAKKVADEIDRKLIARIYLQIGKFMEETRSVDSNSIITVYKNSIDIWPQQDDSFYCLGSYYEQVLEQSSAKVGHHQDQVLPKIHQFYVNSLTYGNKYIFQALPRLLSIWLDQGSKLHTVMQDLEKSASQGSEKVTRVKLLKANIDTINSAMLKVIHEGSIAPYQLFTAFSQLISRICHPVESVFEVLKKVLVMLIREYPQQALWLSVAVRNSSVAMRSERCAQIFEEAKRQASFAKLFQASTALTNHLKELCEKNSNAAPPDMYFSLKTTCSKLHKLLISSEFSEIIIPRMDSLTASIPESKQDNFQPFRNDRVFIHSFEDRVDILMSMQRPKKFVVIGSDGNTYPMMAKPKDDLRKDYRVLECNVIINQFLLRDAEARKRQLHIRTYAVIALDKENGLVEWIKNTQAFRPICYRIYKERNKGLTPREIKSLQPARNAASEVFLNLYRNTLIPKHSPPVLRDWFTRTFTDPTAWFLARLAFCRTAAVMSIVGYIWGLGQY